MGISFRRVGCSLKEFACGLSSAGKAYCWGENSGSTLGDGTTTTRGTPAIIPGYTWTSVSAGYHNACGVTVAGAAYCWGANDGGQVGDNTGTQRNSPTLVLGGLTWSTISAGGYGDPCAITTTHDAYYWGNNYNGELGDGTTVDKYVPTAISGGMKWLSIDPNYGYACGVNTQGVGYCWGWKLTWKSG